MTAVKWQEGEHDGVGASGLHDRAVILLWDPSGCRLTRKLESAAREAEAVGVDSRTVTTVPLFHHGGRARDLILGMQSWSQHPAQNETQGQGGVQPRSLIWWRQGSPHNAIIITPAMIRGENAASIPVRVTAVTGRS